MKKALCALALLFVAACATAHAPTEYDPNVIHVPIVEIRNKNFQDVVIYLEGARFADVSGPNGDILVQIHPGRIPGDRKLHFTYKLIGDATTRYQLPEVIYQGRKMVITIEEHTPASSAWLKKLGK